MYKRQKDNKTLSKLQTINNSASSLLEIVNDILDISKIESGRFKIQPVTFNIRALITSCIQIQDVGYEGRITSHFGHNIPEFIHADELRIKQILNNLLSNAIKFTPNGTIEITTEYKIDEIENKYLYCSIKDNGIGISEQMQKNIFLSFIQEDSSTTRMFGGTGLGLTITKNLVDLMKGKIWLNSKKGEGSIFSFKIPVGSPIRNSTEQRKDISLDYSELTIRILMVEDNIINQKVLDGLLKKMHLTASIVSNGEEALHILREQKFDLIFMDCHMPILDGFKATEAIIKTYKEDRPYIIAVTASAMQEDKDRCYNSGMDDFISKPISISSLSKALEYFKSKKELKES